MSVWYCIPSKRPSGECGKLLQAWKDMGYKLMIHADSTAEANGKSPYADQLSIGPYLGYPRTVNGLIRAVMRQDPAAQWFVTGGDDIWPDPTYRAEDIALSCDEHFGGTFGVMQPTMDRWGEANNDSGKGGALIDHVAGSPWLGREFCRRMNGGQGPFWPEYFHMFDDAELQASLALCWLAGVASVDSMRGLPSAEERTAADALLDGALSAFLALISPRVTASEPEAEQVAEVADLSSRRPAEARELSDEELEHLAAAGLEDGSFPDSRQGSP